MAVSLTPWFGTVTGGAANTPQSIQALLAALAASAAPNIGPSNVLRAAYIQVQADPLGGGVKFYIGRSTMSATDFGVQLVAAQVWTPPSAGLNLYRLDQIFLMADGQSANWNITFITR